MEKIIILGKGGHASSMIDAIERFGEYEIAGYIINEDVEIEDEKYPIIGKDEDLAKIYQNGIHNAAIGIGFLGKGVLRNKLYRKLKEIGYSLPIISDPTAIISKKADIHEGTFIGKGAIVNAGAQIGKMCIINTGAIVEHDCRISDFSHIAVGAVLCGEVNIGKNTLVGANATVIQGKSIGNGCIVGAGETVIQNVEDNKVIYQTKTNMCLGG